MLASFLVLGLVAGCGKSSKARVYVVATEAEFPPFESKNEKGELVGFDIELVRAIAAKAGIEIRFQDMSFEGLIPSILSGQADLAASALSITEERKKSVAFSDPYLEAGLCISVAANNTTIKSSADLKGKVAAVQQGSTSAAKAMKLVAEGKLGEVKQYNNTVLCMMELTKGGVDVVINDLPTSEVYVSKQPDKVRVLPEILVSDNYGFVFAKGSTELLAKWNKALAEVKADGTYSKLSESYFGKK